MHEQTSCYDCNTFGTVPLDETNKKRATSPIQKRNNERLVIAFRATNWQMTRTEVTTEA